MPTFTYIPKRSVIPAHRSAFRDNCQVTIATNEVSVMGDRVETDRTVVRNRAGTRRKVIKHSEQLCVDLTVNAIDIMDRPEWLEFFHSVNCGERFVADLCDIPGFTYGVDVSSATIEEDQDWGKDGAHVWSVSFTVKFDNLRTIL